MPGQALGFQGEKRAPPLPRMTSRGLTKPWGVQPGKICPLFQSWPPQGQSGPGVAGQGIFIPSSILSLFRVSLLHPLFYGCPTQDWPGP